MFLKKNSDCNKYNGANTILFFILIALFFNNYVFSLPSLPWGISYGLTSLINGQFDNSILNDIMNPTVGIDYYKIFFIVIFSGIFTLVFSGALECSKKVVSFFSKIANKKERRKKLATFLTIFLLFLFQLIGISSESISSILYFIGLEIILILLMLLLFLKKKDFYIYALINVVGLLFTNYLTYFFYFPGFDLDFIIPYLLLLGFYLLSIFSLDKIRKYYKLPVLIIINKCLLSVFVLFVMITNISLNEINSNSFFNGVQPTKGFIYVGGNNEGEIKLLHNKLLIPDKYYYEKFPLNEKIRYVNPNGRDGKVLVDFCILAETENNYYISRYYSGKKRENISCKKIRGITPISIQKKEGHIVKNLSNPNYGFLESMKYNVIITNINDISLDYKNLYSYYSMVLFDDNPVFLDNFFKVFRKYDGKYVDNILYKFYSNLIMLDEINMSLLELVNKGERRNYRTIFK